MAAVAAVPLLLAFPQQVLRGLMVWLETAALVLPLLFSAQVIHGLAVAAAVGTSLEALLAVVAKAVAVAVAGIIMLVPAVLAITTVQQEPKMRLLPPEEPEERIPAAVVEAAAEQTAQMAVPVAPAS